MKRWACALGVVVIGLWVAGDPIARRRDPGGGSGAGGAGGTSRGGAYRSGAGRGGTRRGRTRRGGTGATERRGCARGVRRAAVSEADAGRHLLRGQLARRGPSSSADRAERAARERRFRLRARVPDRRRLRIRGVGSRGRAQLHAARRRGLRVGERELPLGDARVARFDVRVRAEHGGICGIGVGGHRRGVSADRRCT